MPCMIRILTPDGLVETNRAAESLAEAAADEPNGVYTITNTYNRTQVLKMDAHLNRLEDSARRENIPLKLDRPRLRAALREMIESCDYGDVRFRITVPQAAPDQLILSLEPFTPPPPEAYREGVRCVTVPHSKRHNPDAKTTDWMHDRMAIQRSFARGIYEGLLLNEDGYILEGLSSNFYGILSGELHTAAAGMLPGIALQIVLEIAPAILPVKREAIHQLDILRLDEAFITSASRGIVPVIEIDGTRIGDGMPGTFTRALMEAYRAWVDTHLEEL